MSSNKPKAYISRQGNVHTAYVDPGSNQLVPFYEWGQEPTTAFPFWANSYEELGAALKEAGIFIGNYEPVFIEPPKKTQPELVVTPEIEAEAERQIAARRTEKGQPPPALPKSNPQDALMTRLLSLFSELPEEEVEPVGSFLITLFPELETALIEARLPKAPTPRKRFKLG